MKSYLRTIVAAAFFIAALILTLEISAQAQGRRAKQRRANQQPPATVPSQSSTNDGQTQTGGNPKLRRVYSVTLTNSQISSLRSISGIQKVLSISGRTVRPRGGSSLWALQNGAYILIGQTDSNSGYASQATYKPLPNGSMYFAICMCFLGDGSDSCRFDGSATRQNCGGQMCCGFKEGEIGADGTVKTY